MRPKSCRFALAIALLGAPACVAERPLRSTSVRLPQQEQSRIKSTWPSIACWFWTDEERKPGGYRRFLDLHERHSAFGLLTTSLRCEGQLTDPELHAQLKAASEYARGKGMGLVLDLDVRLARESFAKRYPGELQQIVLLREFPIDSGGAAGIRVDPLEFADHYTFGRRGYDALSSELLGVFSYRKVDGLAQSGSVVDISERALTTPRGAGLEVLLSCDDADEGRTACALVAVTHFTPAAFAPHILSYQRELLEQYADASLAGACKDEWGFPGRFDPSSTELWYSRFMAEAYARRRPGRDLRSDMLLMAIGERGREGERVAAVNHYMEMCRERHCEIEADFDRGVREVLGPEALTASHATWFPYPGEREIFKNGLSWWGAPRALAQTDESTPFCVRTALAKKARSPLWYNMSYAESIDDYRQELWSSVLAGGRLNLHPRWPLPMRELGTSLLEGDLLRAAQRVQLLDYISTAPVDCPVAIVFGHPASMNWADSGDAHERFAKVGMELSDALWKAGVYADLIPSSEIENGSLRIASDGSVQYGAQRYAALVLYQPEFERPAVAKFFRTAARSNRTTLYRVGEWKRDFEGRPFDGAAALPSSMLSIDASAECARLVRAQLDRAGIVPQACGELRQSVYDASVAPRATGSCRLLDGTIILASGERSMMGDPIREHVRVNGHIASFDAIGLAAVRFDAKGQVVALAAGGLRSFRADSLKIELEEPLDFALFREEGQWRGIVHGDAALPSELKRITTRWLRVRTPERYQRR